MNNNENNIEKKDILIGVLIAIIIVLLIVMIAISIVKKTRQNDNDNFDVITMEKELNDYVKNNPTLLEKKYGLMRKIEVSSLDEEANTYDYDISYYYNGNFVFSIFPDVYSAADLETVKQALEKDYIYIEEFKDLKSEQNYYLVGDIYSHKKSAAECFDDPNCPDTFYLETYIYSTDFVRINYISENEGVTCYGFIVYSDETDLLSDGGKIQLNNNKIRYYSLSYDDKVLIQDVYFENGNLIKKLVDEISLDDVIIYQERC